MAYDRNPFFDVEEFFERMGRQFEEAAGRWDWREELGAGSIAVDAVDEGDEFVVTADLPGFETDDIEAWVTDHTLRIEAERAEERETGDEQYIHRERSRRSMSRSVTLPEPVETEGVTASYRNGVLTVHVPKAEPASEGHAIDIE